MLVYISPLEDCLTYLMVVLTVFFRGTEILANLPIEKGRLCPAIVRHAIDQVANELIENYDFMITVQCYMLIDRK